MYSKEEFILPDGSYMTPEEIVDYLNTVEKPKHNYKINDPNFFKLPVRSNVNYSFVKDDKIIDSTEYINIPLISNDICNEISNLIMKEYTLYGKRISGIVLNMIYFYNLNNRVNTIEKHGNKLTFMGIPVYYSECEEPITIIYEHP